MSVQIEKIGNYIRYIFNPVAERTEKGMSLICFPADYTVVDIETSGLDLECNSVIEVAALRVRGGAVVDKFSSLIKPVKWYYLPDDYDEDEYDDEDNALIPLDECEGYYYIDEYITLLTGITNEMLDSAPEATSVLTEFVKFIGEDILVGHNVNFDVNFLYEAISSNLGTPLKNNFIDTMRLSRKLFPESAHHRSCDLAENCGVAYEGAHRALQDCIITQGCFEKMREIVTDRYASEDEFAKLFNRHGSKKIDCSSIVAESTDFDEEHPFYHRTVVFTGALSGIVRKDAMQSVVNVGGYISDNVTKATNYLVVGSFDYIKSVKGNKSSKMKKAEKMKLDGFDIEVISENTFLEMLANK